MPRLALLAALSVAAACGTSSETVAPAPAGPMVAAEGQRFDPPVPLADIPDGAWMCDMGTVHWAAGEKNDGKCPVCGMNLTQKK